MSNETCRIQTPGEAGKPVRLTAMTKAAG